MTEYVRFGYARTTSAGSYSVPRVEVDAEVEKVLADDTIVTAFYYLHPSSSAVWVKGDGATHARLTAQINELSR